MRWFFLLVGLLAGFLLRPLIVGSRDHASPLPATELSRGLPKAPSPPTPKPLQEDPALDGAERSPIGTEPESGGKASSNSGVVQNDEESRWRPLIPQIQEDIDFYLSEYRKAYSDPERSMKVFHEQIQKYGSQVGSFGPLQEEDFPNLPDPEGTWELGNLIGNIAITRETFGPVPGAKSEFLARVLNDGPRPPYFEIKLSPELMIQHEGVDPATLDASTRNRIRQLWVGTLRDLAPLNSEYQAYGTAILNAGQAHGVHLPGSAFPEVSPAYRSLQEEIQGLSARYQDQLSLILLQARQADPNQ